jgi:hypothetical protein
MHTEESPKLLLLRIFLMLDAVILLLLGGLFIGMPARVELAFDFNGLPEGVSYLIGLWGCALGTMAIGYALAALDPVRNVAWIHVGIARGGLECVFGSVCIARGIVTWQQAVPGIVVAAIVTLAYIVLYPASMDAVISIAVVVFIIGYFIGMAEFSKSKSPISCAIVCGITAVVVTAAAFYAGCAVMLSGFRK